MSTVSTPTNATSTRRLSLVSSEEDQIRIRGIGSFIDRHALSLHSTLEAVAGPKGAEVVEELVGALSAAWPDPVLVTASSERRATSWPRRATSISTASVARRARGISTSV